MHIQPQSTIIFGIYKGSSQKPYGEYIWGEYKGLKIEVFDAYKHHQKLFYVSKCFNFIKSKFVYWVESAKKITRYGG